MRVSSGGRASAANSTAGIAAGGFGAGNGCRASLSIAAMSLGLLRAALRFEPARRLRQILAQPPHDQRADAGDHEHRPPSPIGNDEITEQRRDRQSGHHQERHEGEPAAARLRRHEFGQCRVADHDLGTEAEPHDEAQPVQRRHVEGGRGSERGKAEDHEVDLVGEAAPVAVAEEAGDEGADGHAEEGLGDEVGIER
jgi:hypothetical protein